MGHRLSLHPVWRPFRFKREIPHGRAVPHAVDVAGPETGNAVRVESEAVAAVQPSIATLFDVCGAQAYSLSLRLLDGDRQQAEDVVHAVFVEISRAIPALATPDTSTLSAITLQRVRQRCIDLMRSAKEPLFPLSGGQVQLPQVTEQSQTTPTPAKVREALAWLSFEQRTVIELAYFEGRTSHEIASRTGGTTEDVNRRLRLALRHLAARMSMKGAEDLSQ